MATNPLKQDLSTAAAVAKLAWDARLAAGKSEYYVRCTKLKGFAVRMYDNGGRCYHVGTTVDGPDGNRVFRQKSLGDVTRDKALLAAELRRVRDEAYDFKRSLKGGATDAVLGIREARRAQQHAKEQAAQRAAELKARNSILDTTLRQALDVYCAQTTIKDSTKSLTRGDLERNCADMLDQPLRDWTMAKAKERRAAVQARIHAENRAAIAANAKLPKEQQLPASQFDGSSTSHRVVRGLSAVWQAFLYEYPDEIDAAGGFKQNPFLPYLKKNKMPQGTPPKPLSDSHLRATLAVTLPNSKLNSLFWRFLVLTGLRATAALGMRWEYLRNKDGESVALNKAVALVLPKSMPGNKVRQVKINEGGEDVWRIIPVTPTLRALLREVWAVDQALLSSGQAPEHHAPWIFPSHYTEQGGRKLSAKGHMTGPQHLIAAIRAASGIARRMHPHVSRYTLGRILRNELKANDENVALVLGHTKSTITMRYSAAEVERIAAVYLPLHKYLVDKCGA